VETELPKSVHDLSSKAPQDPHGVPSWSWLELRMT
jgi:hypothetical protein